MLLQELQKKDSGAPGRALEGEPEPGLNGIFFSHFRLSTQGPTLTLWFALPADEERAQKNSCDALI